MPNSRSKNAIIIGGSSGIGLLITKMLSDKGAKTIIADIKAPSKLFENSLFHKIDITNAAEISEFYNKVINETGVPDIIICNAGVHEGLSKGGPEKWNGIIELNFLGSMKVARAFLPAMLKEKKGDILFINSPLSKPASKYSASKSSLEIAAENLKIEVQPDIRLTTIAPGGVDTMFYKKTEGRASHKNKKESSYDFAAEKYIKTLTQTLAEPSDAWSGAATIDWANKLYVSEFNPEANGFVNVAEIIDRIYKRI